MASWLSNAFDSALLRKSGDKRQLGASPDAEARTHLSLQGPQLAGLPRIGLDFLIHRSSLVAQPTSPQR